MAGTPESLSCLSGYNALFLRELYRAYLQNSHSIDPSWHPFLDSFHEHLEALNKEERGPSWAYAKLPDVHPLTVDISALEPVNEQALKRYAQASINALSLVRAYREHGHTKARLDPLGIAPLQPHPELSPHYYGLHEVDYGRQVFVGGILGFQILSLGSLLERLEHIYGGTLGLEYAHIQDLGQKEWLQQRMEKVEERYQFSLSEKKKLLSSLIKAESFERFLHVKFPGAKRFGLEGGESLVPLLQELAEHASLRGTRNIVLGMAHRGRLNVLANFIGKPYHAIFKGFQPHSHNHTAGSGDVKYHLGYSCEQIYGGQPIRIEMLPNPSHLESINAVVAGNIRAKQMLTHDNKRQQNLGILVHGDAAIAGQGSVAETFCLAHLPGYCVGGMIHIILNNQIGFTTSPLYSRSSLYCSEIAKVVQAPIFHVNGDDPEAVLYVAHIASDFRHQFQKDVVIDLLCYRRHGHNEMDEPAFTQPIMYRTIREKASVNQVYQEKLIQESCVSSEEIETINKGFTDLLSQEFEKANSPNVNPSGLSSSSNQDFSSQTYNTGAELSLLKRVGKSLTRIPKGFALHPRLQRIVKERERTLTEGQGIDWATAEALAFGTLLCQGYGVRLSGQDSIRGTFSQRHTAFIDQETEESYIPLNHIDPQQALLEALDSPLSEAAVLGFEYGYSLVAPLTLVLWEAQFGDFANGAQVIIDQYIASGEAKWGCSSKLVLLLPHGYVGQGPEHSSARLERYLQLSAEDNWCVVNCTTPANYFHVLRRQIQQDQAKPLIIMAMKSHLRHPLAVSSLNEMGPESKFHAVIDDPINYSEIKRLIFCSGKIYYDLLEERSKRSISTVALIRLEQLYPFPLQEITDILKRYPKAELVWCQEEPKNMGAWSHIYQQLSAGGINVPFSSLLRYIGRPAAASPATGYPERHAQEQNDLIEEAFKGCE